MAKVYPAHGAVPAPGQELPQALALTPRACLDRWCLPALLRDLAVAPGAVLGRAMWGADRLGPLEAVALAATTPCPTGQ